MKSHPIPQEIQNPVFLNDEERIRVGKEIMVNSLPSGTFFGMNLLASIIAAYGLLQNSPAVVIGAMLVAMMIGPIAGLGLAVLREDRKLLSVAATSVGLGTLWVPPLVTCGILLSRGQFNLAAGAFLLTLTNMLAIQFAFSIVLWMAGFRRRKDGRDVGFVRSNIWSLILLGGLGVMLTLNLTKAATRQRLDVQVTEALRNELETGRNKLISTKIHLKDARGPSDSDITVMAYMQGDVPPTREQVQKAQAALPRLGNLPPLRLQLRFVPVSIIEGELPPADAKKAP